MGGKCVARRIKAVGSYSRVVMGGGPPAPTRAGGGGMGGDGCPSSAGRLATHHNIVGKQIPFNAHVAMRGWHNTPHPPQQLTGVVI